MRDVKCVFSVDYIKEKRTSCKALGKTLLISYYLSEATTQDHNFFQIHRSYLAEFAVFY